jgi:hypothetical protein
MITTLWNVVAPATAFLYTKDEINAHIEKRAYSDIPDAEYRAQRIGSG